MANRYTLVRLGNTNRYFLDLIFIKQEDLNFFFFFSFFKSVF